MASNDVRDMLGMDEAAPRPAKKQKTSAPRSVLKGFARELQNLSGDNPIAIIPEVSVFKRKRFASRKPAAPWELREFTNSARKEVTKESTPLVLRHWKRKNETVPRPGEGEDVMVVDREPEESMFAKYGVSIKVPTYTDEQYSQKLHSDSWSREETDYLLRLAQDFDLRWPLIWDRYEYQPSIPGNMEGVEGALVPAAKERTMEDLKQRYYFLAATMMKIDKPVEIMTQAEFNHLELMQNFNPVQETNRKRFAEAALKRTKEEAREEESLLLELKRILARSERLTEERRELYARLEAPQSTANISQYSSSQGLQILLTQLLATDKAKKRKSIVGLPGDGISPAGPSSSMSQHQAQSDRRDSTTTQAMFNNSTVGPSSSSNNNKKGPGPAERRRLSQSEEEMYGVKHFDRITSSGPAFRHERILKPITTKSAVQQSKITNVLTELGIPSRLGMPTAAMGDKFDRLMTGVNALLDMRKVADKLTGEIGFLKGVKEERERRARAERGEPESLAKEDGDAPAASTETNAHEDDVPAHTTGENVGVKAEDKDKDREQSAAPSVRGESAAHKRSASVLSAASEQSTKKQKKN